MGPLIELIGSVIRSYPSIFSNAVVDGLYLVVLVLVAVQYHKIQSLEEKMYGAAKNKAFRNTLYAIGLGLVGGLLASLLLVVVGVSVSDSGIGYLFPLALLLFLVGPRFVCYSYAGGLAGLSYLLFGWPKINVPSVMGLVACLHAAESFLIRISGHSCSTPFYVSRKDGQVVGGFALQRFWPIPLIVLFLIQAPFLADVQDLIYLPDWWPLIRTPSELRAEHMIFAMMPVIAALGYGDIAVATNPKDKSISTSKNLMLFSVVLLVLSIMASRWPFFAWVAVLFSPIGHELAIKKGLKEEFENPPIYVPPEKGVMVLDVVHGSVSEKSGIRSGDIIVSVDGLEVGSRDDFANSIESSESETVVLTVKRTGEDGKAETIHTDVRRTHGEALGIILVPEPGDEPMVSQYSEGIIVTFIKKMLRKKSLKPTDTNQ